MTAPKQRPQADRRQLQQIIAGLNDGVVLLDPDGTIVWANPAALAAYGVARLSDFGRTEAEFFARFNLRYRNHHQLAAAESPVARLRAGDEFSELLLEVTRPGDDTTPKRVHCLRGAVLTDAAGQAESLVLVIHDLTEQYGAEERFERMFNANPAPAVICGIEDLRFVKVNQGFLDMTGFAKRAVLGRSVYEIDVLEDAPDRDGAIERLNNWQTIRQTEASLRIAAGAVKPVVVAGQPIEFGSERCMLFTFMDLEPRKQAEVLLRQSEERFAKAFRLAPVPMMLMTLEDFKILDVNESFAQALGAGAPSAIGRTAYEAALWETAEQRRGFVKILRDTGSLRNFEARLLVPDREPADYLISAEVVEILARKCVLSVMLDISERKRTEAELVAAIEAVMKDTSWFSQTVIEKLATLRQPKNGARLAGVAELTLREREVLELICDGASDSDIAQKLGLSRNTVRNHVAAMYGKIGVHRRNAAVVWARERGITGPRKRR